MKKIVLLLAFLAVVIDCNFAQQQGLKKLDFFIGKWKLETIDIRSDGSFVKGKARSEVKYILDGYAMQDDFLMLDQNDNIVFRGTSIRSYNPTTAKYQIVWVMPGYKGITDIEGEMIDGKLVTTGRGYDQMGEFLERFEYYDISENAYSFKMDRSYDGGKTWIVNFSRINAKRIE